jgi:hypothetical protein
MEIPTLAIARREMEIIGVSKNAHYGDLKDDTPPVVYIPYNQGTEPPLNEASLETQTGGQLNLTPRADSAKYSAYVVGEIAGSILEDGISVASQCKWTLRVTSVPLRR